jgi:hypothetical protein
MTMDTTTNLNADGSLRIENVFSIGNKFFRKTFTMSNVITVCVEVRTAGVMLFDTDAKSDTAVFQIGEYEQAMDWASNCAVDFSTAR